MCAACPTHLILLDDHSDYWQRVQIMKLLSPASYYFIPLGFKYSPQHSVLIMPRDQISHQQKTTGKLAVLHILIFMFLESR
jgi:hypothetical protein